MRSMIVLAVLASACSSNTTAPSTTPPIPTPAPSTFTVSGRVTATNGGQPLAGVAVTMGPAVATTDGTGAFSTSMNPGTVRVTLAGAGILARSVTAAVNGTRDLPLDAIALGGGFDPGFYRQFVRNTYANPSGMEPIRRWTQNPNIYLRTINEAGAAMDAKTLDVTEATLRDTAPMWTNGRLQIASVVRGTDTRVGVPGWITVRFAPPTPNTNKCGQAEVGVSGGWIDLYSNTPGIECRCAGVSDIRPLTVRHELGHALGFWHTDSALDVMAGIGVSGCDALPSARERYHAAIAYNRPVGNLDPDTDPSTAVLSMPTIRVY